MLFRSPQCGKVSDTNKPEIQSPEDCRPLEIYRPERAQLAVAHRRRPSGPEREGLLEPPGPRSPAEPGLQLGEHHLQAALQGVSPHSRRSWLRGRAAGDPWVALPPGALYTRLCRQDRQTNAGTYNSRHRLEAFLEAEVPAWRRRWMRWGRGEERKGRDLGSLGALVSQPATQLVLGVSKRRPQPGPRAPGAAGL